MTVTVRSGRGWAYTGAALGGLVSIAANVAHSFIPPKEAPDGWAPTPDAAIWPQGWTPEPGAVVGAIVWPVFLFVAVEILARVAWPTGRAWQAIRWAGVLPVAAVAALVSYRHLSGLLTHYGEEDIVSILGPLAVDGLMVMATGALLATSRHRTVPPSVSATPARTDAAPAPTPVTVLPAPTVPQPAPADTPARPEVPTPAALAARITSPRPNRPAAPATVPGKASRPAGTRPSKTTASTATRLAPSTTDIHVSASDAAQPTLPMVPPDLLTRATDVAGKYHAEHGTPITPGQLAVRPKVATEQAGNALNQINEPTVNGRPRKATR